MTGLTGIAGCGIGEALDVGREAVIDPEFCRRINPDSARYMLEEASQSSGGGDY